MAIDNLAEHDAELSQILASYWYYTIEIKPGVFSNGNNHVNTLLTRELLRRIDPRGLACLDIGTMEGLIPTLLKRRGADYVAAADRFQYQRKVDLVQSAFGVEWDYLPGTAILDLQTTLGDRLPMDLVVFSGVLYHMFDPLGGLARVRALVHPGSLVVVETLAVVEDSMAMYFNHEQHFYPHTTFFAPSIPCLDAFLRMVGLNPIDCVWFDHPRPTEQRFCRIGVTCRAASVPLLSAAVPQSVMNDAQNSFKEFAPIERFTSTAGDAVAYASGHGLRNRADTDSIDLYATVLDLPEFERDKDKTLLRLSDRD